MNAPNERPPLFAKERARKEATSSNCVFLPPRKPPGQLSEQTFARMWIGADWIALITEIQQNNACGVCIGHQRHVTRMRDVDEAAAAYRAAATRCKVEARITPQGRVRGDGIKLAYELKQRGIDVSFDSPDEDAMRIHERFELDWADKSNTPFASWRD
jgi:hypothetical protein